MEREAAEQEAAHAAKAADDKRLTDELEVPRSKYIAEMNLLRGELLAWREVDTLLARWAVARAAYQSAVDPLLAGRGSSWRAVYDAGTVEARHPLTKAASLLVMVAP